MEFSAESLDDRNWVVDFGGFADVKHWLELMFDHTTLIAPDDPELSMFEHLHRLGLINLVVPPKGVGCERFAEMIAAYVANWLLTLPAPRRVWLSKVEVREHGANAAAVELSRPEQSLLFG